MIVADDAFGYNVTLSPCKECGSNLEFVTNARDEIVVLESTRAVVSLVCPKCGSGYGVNLNTSGDTIYDGGEF